MINHDFSKSVRIGLSFPKEKLVRFKEVPLLSGPAGLQPSIYSTTLTTELLVITINVSMKCKLGPKETIMYLYGFTFS